MKQINRWAAVCGAILLLLSCLTVTGTALEPSAAFYVNDAANVLEEETEGYICDENWRLYDLNKGAEAVVVTVDFLDGRNAEEYAYQIFSDWQLGDPDEDNGVLILLCPGEEKYWVMTGKGLQQELDAGRLQTLIDQWLEPAFAEQDYDRAALAIFKAIVAELDQKYGVTAADVEAYWGLDTPAGDLSNDHIFVEDAFIEDGPGYESAGTSDLFYMATGIITLVVLILLVTWLMQALRRIGQPRTYTGNPMPRRSFWDFGPSVRPRSTRSYTSRPRSTRSSFGSSSRSSRSGSGRSFSGRSSGGGRRGGGGSSRGGGAGRR